MHEIKLWPSKSLLTTVGRRREVKLVAPPEYRLLGRRAPEFGGLKERVSQPARDLFGQ